MRTFLVVWAGQLVSITGTTLTGFGLQLFVFTETGSVTQLSLVSLAFVLPAVVFAPLAGSVVDRFDRRRVMLLSDLAAGVATLGLFFIYQTGDLQLWQIYLATAVGATANAFQDPAWMASITVLVPKDRLGRANGLVQLNRSLSIVVAPALAGALLALSGLGAVLLVDAVTFGVGVVTLVLVRFPPFTREQGPQRTVRGDTRFAWEYLRERPGLLGLLWVYAGVNFTLSATNVLIIPLIVSFSTETAAGLVLSAAGAGAVVGSVAVGVWGVPDHKMPTIIGGITVSGVLLALAGVRAALPLIVIASVLMLAINPVVNAASQVIWQTKVAEGAQGRVFSLRFMIGRIVSPLAIFIIGPVADSLFEPAMDIGGPLAGTVGELIGSGPGRGIGLIYVVAGAATVAIALIGWSLPRIRNIETELPDLAGRE